MTTRKLTVRYARYLLTSLATVAFGLNANSPPQRQPDRRLVPLMGKGSVMFEDNADASIVARGLAEALACQDRLERIPPRPGRLARLRVRMVNSRYTLVASSPKGALAGVGEHAGTADEASPVGERPGHLT